MQACKGRGGTSFEKVGLIRGQIYCQKVYLMFSIFLLGNNYRPEESRVNISTPVHPGAAHNLAHFQGTTKNGPSESLLRHTGT